jgi:hypothetical protein
VSKRGDGPRIRRLEALLQALSGGAGSVTSVSGSAPIASSGGPAPTISITPATDAAAGSMSAADKTKLDGLVPVQPFFVGYDSIVAPHIVVQGAEPLFMDRDAIGTPMQITFPSWADGDVLEVSFNMTLDLVGDGLTSAFRAYAAVSTDGGATFRKLNYSGNTWTGDPDRASVYLQKATSHAGHLTVGATFSQTLPDPVTAGDTIIVEITTIAFTGCSLTDTSNITDNFGNVYAQQRASVTPDAGASMAVSVWAAFGVNVGTTGAPLTITATVGKENYFDVALMEYPASAGLRVANDANRFGGGAIVPQCTLAGSALGDVCISALADANGVGLSTLGAFGAHAASGVYAPDPNGDFWAIQDGTSDGAALMTARQGTSDDFWAFVAIALLPPASGNHGFLSLNGLGSVVIHGTTPPIVRLAYFYDTGLLSVDSPAGGAAGQGAILKAVRIPSASIVGTPPLSVLQAF